MRRSEHVVPLTFIVLTFAFAAHSTRHFAVPKVSHQVSVTLHAAPTQVSAARSLSVDTVASRDAALRDTGTVGAATSGLLVMTH